MRDRGLVHHEDPSEQTVGQIAIEHGLEVGEALAGCELRVGAKFPIFAGVGQQVLTDREAQLTVAGVTVACRAERTGHEPGLAHDAVALAGLTAGVETELHIAGKKGIAFFRFRGEPITSQVTDIGDVPSVADAERLMGPLRKQALELY